MDSDPSAPEFASQDSNQSGSAPLSSSLEGSDDNQVLMQKPTTGVAEVGNNDATNVFVNGGGGVTEKDGFVSDEEFETPMARAVRLYSDEKSAEGGFVHAPFVNSEEFFTPKAWRGIADESVDDDGRVARDDKLEKGDGDGGGGDFNFAGEGAEERLESGEAKGGYEDDVVQTESIKGSGFSDDGHEEFVEDYRGRDNEGSENGKVEESTHSVFEGGMVAEQNGAQVRNLKDEEAVKEQSSYDLQQETPVEVDNGAQVVRTGDSIVDTVQVDVLPSGVAIVGEKEDLDDSEIKGMETPAGGVSLDNGFDPIEGEVEEPFEESTTSEVKSDLIVDDDSKHADNGFDPIEREVEEPFEETTTSEVKSDLNFDDDSEHAEKGVHIASPEEVEKLDFESPSVDTEVKDDEAVKEENSEILYDTQKPLPVEPEGGSQVFTAGDSVVDTVQVNLLPSGVAVVGDKEVIDASEIQGMEAPASGVSLDNGFEPIEGDAEEPFDKIATSDVNSDHSVDNAVDDNNKHAEKGMNIAPPEEVEKLDVESHIVDREIKDLQEVPPDEVETSSHVKASGESLESEYVDPISSSSQETRQGENDEGKHNPGNIVIDGSASDDETGGMIFGSSEAARRFMEELEQHSGAESSRDPSQRLDGQIVTDSDEEVDTDEEGDGKEIFDSAALAALLKAATGAGQDGGNITITAQDGSRLFSVERPAGLGSSLQSIKPAARSNRVGLYPPSYPRVGADSDSNLSEEEKKKLEKVQQLRIKYLRLIERLGFTTEESIAAQTLFRLALITGRQNSQLFTLDDAKRSASELEAEGKDDLDFSLNILVIGKSGVGKSATINSIFGEAKTSINAYGPATTTVTEIVGMVDGVKIRVFDTPGLKSYAAEQNFNRKVLSTVKKFTKKSSPDIVLFVDRLDTPSRNLNDLPLLKTVTDVLGTSIWQNAIVTLTHAASAPPDGPSGSPIGYDAFVAQRSHIVQQSIGQAVGDLRLMNPSLMNPVSLAENHPSCRKNRDGEKVLPNGQSWRPQLLLLCYSMKILAEAANLYKTQDKSDHRKLFGFRVRSPPLPYLLSWLLQSRTHPKLSADQGGDNADSDIELADLSDSDIDDDEDEYDQLPPFKPLKQSQIDKLSREQRKAYFDEYDYRVKLLQKKQWREELKRMRDMKKRGKTTVNDYNYMEEDDQENGSPAAVPVPLPDMVLPPSFDCDNPAYRYRFLEPTSQLLTRPVLDNHGWDHDCGYDGVNLEQTLAIINRFPAAVTVQVTKDKKDFSIHLDSSVAAKHGENGSTMAGFDIQNIGKQIAYICRGETKFKNFKRNKTAAGVSVTFLGENVTTGLKVEDQIALGKRLVLVGSTGTVRCQGDSAYGANVEVRIREADFPIGQDQSSLGLSLVKWRGDLALGANFQSQFSVGRNYKMAVRAGLNNKLSGQISVRTSSSDQLQIALVAILPIARAIYKNFWPGARENDSIY